MQVKICKADARHLPDINRLIVETRIGEPENKLDGQFWFVRRDNRIVGCIGGKMIGAKTAVLTHLAVEGVYRKQGIGMALFDHALSHFCSRGATVIGFITMYYHFRRFKRRGFQTRPRKLLPEPLKSHQMFTAQQYMKCAAMVQTFASKPDVHTPGFFIFVFYNCMLLLYTHHHYKHKFLFDGKEQTPQYRHQTSFWRR